MREKLLKAAFDKMFTLDELVELSMYAREMENEYGALDMEYPEEFRLAAEALRAEITKRRRDADLALMRTLESQIEATKTATEKRADLTRQMAAVQKRLGVTSRAKSA